MNQQARLTAVVVTLVASAIAAVAATWLVSMLMIDLGITGMTHAIALMLVMPLSFGVVALLIARKLLLK